MRGIGKLLQMLRAIGVVKQGNRNVSSGRNPIEVAGGIEAPQQPVLIATVTAVHRLSFFVNQIERPTSLHAMKLYMLLLAFRHNHLNAAQISYESIRNYRFMRA